MNKDYDCENCEAREECENMFLDETEYQPREEWMVERLAVLINAIRGYCVESLMIPYELTDEYNQLVDELDALGGVKMTKQELMETKFSHIKNFDYAIDQGIINDMNDLLDEEDTHIAGHYVTSYEGDGCFGTLFPITEKGEEMLNEYERLCDVQR